MTSGSPTTVALSPGAPPVDDDERDLALVVTARHEPVTDVVVLELADPSGADLPRWTPGAHVDLVLDGDLVRQYSLCGDPADRRTWRIAVLREPAGRGGSAHVHDHLRTGVAVAARGPRNHFALAPAPEYVFVAGGIGITPILAMVRATAAAGLPWTLHYGGRSRSTMSFLDELAELDAERRRVYLHPQDEVGLPDLDAALRAAQGPVHVYACGPAGLLAAVEETAERHGLPVSLERFTPKEVGPPQRSDGFEVHLERSGITLQVPPNRSILDVVEEAGVDVITSCREGTCGSCETDVLEGTPDHRDSLLSEDVDDAMMICVSRAACPRLVLDL